MLETLCGILLYSLLMCFGARPFVYARLSSDSLKSTSYLNSDSIQMNGGFPVTRIFVVLPEELPPGSLVADLTTNPLVKNIQTAFENGAAPKSFHYRLMNTFDSRLFRVGTSTGRMTVATRLDREQLCISQKAQFCCNARTALPPGLLSDSNWKEETDPESKGQQCHLVAHISIQPTTFSSSETSIDSFPNQMASLYIYIRLDDINDHTPQFTTQSTSLNVAEDMPVGTVLQYFQISDPDAGANGLHEVKLDVTPLKNLDINHIQENANVRSMLDTNPFEAQLSQGGVSLLLRKTLDREVIAAYDVTLTAIDGDRVKPRSSQLNLRIHVTDNNDNAPVWIKQSDRGDSATVDQLSTINNGLSTDLQTISKFNVTIPEDTQVGALIFWLQAKDADSGDNARLQYAIDTSAPGGLAALDFFSVQSTTGEVRLRTQIDYDSASLQLSRPEIEVPVIVRDTPRSGRQLSAKATLVVRIVDVNDMYPIIVTSPLQPIPAQSNFHGNFLGDTLSQTLLGVWENRPPGQPIASISVNDPDTGDGGKVACSIQSEYFTLVEESIKPEYYNNDPLSHSISISNPVFETTTSNPGPRTYHLISSKPLDREMIPRHQVVISCRDHDRSRPLVSTQRLDIEVLDENDNKPEFTNSPIQMNCSENAPPGHMIGRINATDQDAGANGKLRFWVDDRYASWIGVQAQTGEVRVNTVFDREVESEREFIVYVTDTDAVTAHTATATVKIRVQDENDHTPHFTELYFFSISEHSPPGTEVGYVQAADEDEGENGKITYSIHPPSREFEIEKETGRLTVRSSGFDGVRGFVSEATKPRISFLDREQQDTYELTVVAEDGGQPSRRTTTVVHIGLTDVNDHAPQFRYPTPHGPGSILNVSCAQLSSQLIARVHANDSDAGRNGEVEYSIVRTPNYSSRMIRDTIMLDLTNTSSEQPFMVELLSNDSVEDRTNIKSDSRSVILNSSDAATSNTTNTRHVKSAPIADPLLGGPTANHFEINSYNGQLFLIHPIMDCSQPADIRLLIRAKDCGDPPLSSTAMLTIHVRPTEDNPMEYPRVLSPNEYGHRLQSGMNKESGAGLWMSRSDSGIRTQRKSSVISNGLVTQFLSNTSHWSAIVGLIVAMVILVLLLVLMLFVLRRRILVNEHKMARKNTFLNSSHDKQGNMTRPLNDDHELYYKGSNQCTSSINEISTGLPHQSSISPTALTHMDDMRCSSMSLVPNSSGQMNTHYFCTVPSSSTALTLNSGEIAVLHHEREGRTVPEKSGSPCQIIYKTSNGDLYGYIETQPRKNGMNRGHTYQTLQPRQTGVREAGICPAEVIRTCRTKNDCFKHDFLLEKHSSAQTSHYYTPLLEHTVQTKLPSCCLQASQPNLSDNKYNATVEHCQTTIGTSAPEQSPLIHSDRALSLTDLTPQTMELLPSTHCLMDETSVKHKTKATRNNPHDVFESVILRKEVPLTRKPGTRNNQKPKSITVAMDSTAGAITSPYNSASFV